MTPRAIANVIASAFFPLTDSSALRSFELSPTV